jgi:copper resistance protein B
VARDGGLSSTEAGVRLRYEIAREFAPYLGVEWTTSADETAQHADGVRYVAGLRFWF